MADDEIPEATIRPTELVPLASLTPHPENYRGHPEDQVEHLKASIRKHGMYRPLVVAADDVVLAGPGLLLAAEALGIEEVPIVRVPYNHDDLDALQLLVGDNEIANLVDDSDAQLISILLRVQGEDPVALLGTGYDAAQLSALQALTAPPKAGSGWDPNAEWEKAGMDPFESGATPDWRLTIRFTREADRQAFLDTLEGTVDPLRKSDKVWLVTLPPDAVAKLSKPEAAAET